MSDTEQISRATEDVARARAELASTVGALKHELTAPVRAAREKLDVAAAVRDHPWTAVALALGAGVAVATSGADRRAATLAADAARSAGASGTRAVESAAQSAASAVKGAPSRTREAVTAACDAIATRLVLGFIDSLRAPPERAEG